MSQRNSYKEIIKATSIFGGTQFIGIVVSIIRSKLVAIFLGPAGMGIVGLLTSTTDLIGSLTNFGLRTSAVKNIAAAYALNDEEQVAVEVTILKRMVWFTGALGVMITLILAPWLSQITFGNTEYTNGFRWISITLLFNQLTAGQDAVLQGMRKLKYLSLSSIYGSVLGLFFVVPIYYIFGVKGIVPVIITTSLVLMLLTWYFVDKTKIAKVSISKEKTWQSGKNMLKMGFLLSLSALLTTGGSYLLRIYISNTGTVVDVGLYNAGFAIIGTYVGMIFSAMGTDYYPRLSGVSHDKIETNKLINQQGEIGLLLLGPVLAIFMTFSGWAVLLLYSTKFLPVTSMIAWASLGMYFKASSWSISYIFLAKSDSKLFFLNELSVIGYGLFFNIFGYYFYGLEGLGISFLLMYFFYFIQVFFVCKKKYDFILQTKFLKILVQQFIIGLCCFLINRYVAAPYSYFFGTLGCLFSIGFSLIELDKLFNLKSLIRKS